MIRKLQCHDIPLCVCILMTSLLHLLSSSSSSSLRNYGLVTESQFGIGKHTVVCIFWSSCLSASSLFVADMTTCKSLWEAQQRLARLRYVLSFIRNISLVLLLLMLLYYCLFTAELLSLFSAFHLTQYLNSILILNTYIFLERTSEPSALLIVTFNLKL